MRPRACRSSRTSTGMMPYVEDEAEIYQYFWTPILYEVSPDAIDREENLGLLPIDVLASRQLAKPRVIIPQNGMMLARGISTSWWPVRLAT